MASFDTAYEWTMDNEDPARKYAVVPDVPEGSHAISGINDHFYPAEFKIIADALVNQRAELVRDFYDAKFWNRWFQALQSDEVAKRVFDAAVNMGPGTAVKLLQTATMNVSGIVEDVDGEWGPTTLLRANTCSADLLASGFRQARVAHYRDIVLKHPEKAKFLAGWLVRAGK